MCEYVCVCLCYAFSRKCPQNAHVLKHGSPVDSGIFLSLEIQKPFSNLTEGLADSVDFSLSPSTMLFLSLLFS